MNFYQLSFGYFSLKIYGILIALAFIIASWHFYKVLLRKSILADFFSHHYWKWVLGGILIGRLLAVALEPQLILKDGMVFFFAFWEGGINFFGTVFGFLLISRYDLKKHGYTFSQWIDKAIPSLLLGIAFADIAAFFTGAVYGKETQLPWGVQYEAFGVDILNPVHPVTIYAFLIHIWLFYWAKSHYYTWEKFPEKLASRVGILFFTADFFLQFLYGNETYLFFGVLRIAQIIDLIFIAMIIWRRKSKRLKGHF